MSTEFDEIAAMQGFVSVLSPLISDNIGVLKNPDGTESNQPAIYLGGNYVPESTLPRVVLNYQGSSTKPITSQEMRVEENPDYDEEDEDSAEYLYYIDTYYNLEYIITLTANSGDTTEVLSGNRKSAAAILRDIRKKANRDSVRTSIHEAMSSGIDTIMPETSVRVLDGVTRTDSANMMINFTYSDVDTEEVGGYIDTVVTTAELSRAKDEDTNPIDMSQTVSG